MLTFDHLAVSGESLEAAQAHVEEALGVKMQAGGEHAVFHTHNALLGLEDGLYLEAIAINPAAPRPDRARWFDLDRFSGPARLTNWICRSDALAKDMAQMPDGIGDIVALERGDLRWNMVVPAKGLLPFDNICPALIEWTTPHHPADRLTPSGCRLRRLVVSHPEAALLEKTIRACLHAPRIVFEQGAAALQAEFETPHGLRSL